MTNDSLPDWRAMTQREYEILRFVSAHSPILWLDTLNAFLPSVLEVDTVLRDALAKKWIEATNPADHPPFCSIRITATGRSVCAAFALVQQEQHQQEQLRQENRWRLAAEKADQKAMRRDDRRFQIKLNVAMVFLGAFLSNLDRIIAWILSIFRS